MAEVQTERSRWAWLWTPNPKLALKFVKWAMIFALLAVLAFTLVGVLAVGSR